MSESLKLSIVNLNFFKSNPSFSRVSNKVLILVLLYASLLLDGSLIKNLKDNSVHIKKKSTCILNHNFFDQSHEVVFRSLTFVIQKIGKKYYPVRGKSINELINRITLKTFSKITLGGCFVESVNETILISRENTNKVKVL